MDFVQIFAIQSNDDTNDNKTKELNQKCQSKQYAHSLLKDQRGQNNITQLHCVLYDEWTYVKPFQIQISKIQLDFD